MVFDFVWPLLALEAFFFPCFEFEGSDSYSYEVLDCFRSLLRDLLGDGVARLRGKYFRKSFWLALLYNPGVLNIWISPFLMDFGFFNLEF